MTSAYTILIIDDEPNLRRTLGLILQQAGYSVTTAGSGGEVKQCLELTEYDLIFLDLQMPDISGMELLPQIREAYPDTPVIILTAHATLESAMEAVRQGARDYILKPVNPRLIIERVQNLISEHDQPRRRRQIMSQMQNLMAQLNQMENSDETGLPVPSENGNSANRMIQCGPFTLDLHTRHVTRNEQSISLSPTAFDYLVTLVRHSPHPVPYETLVLEAQGYETSRYEAKEMVRWRIHELRKSIEPDPQRPRFIITERNLGYRLTT